MNIENDLGIGSRMSPVLPEIMKKRWEEENIRKFGRYVDGSLGIWKGKREELEETEIAWKIKRKGHN